MQVPSMLCAVDPCVVPDLLLSVPEEQMNVAGVQGVVRGLVASVSVQAPVNLVSYPISSSLAADSIEDRVSAEIVSLVGDSGEAVKELDDPAMGGQQVPVGGGCNEVAVY
ncbi:hypothetical protein Dimus_003422 [Dionaea muscipula]